MYLEDHGNPNDSVSDEAERQFTAHYLRHLGDGARFVCLESPHCIKVSATFTNPLVKDMQKPETRCHTLLKETAERLNEAVVTLMLLAVQSNDLGLSIKMAVKR